MNKKTEAVARITTRARCEALPQNTAPPWLWLPVVAALAWLATELSLHPAG